MALKNKIEFKPIDYNRVFDNIKDITNLPLKKHKRDWHGACYLNGSPHSREDKLIVSLYQGQIMLLEQGGEAINLIQWLIKFGGASDYKQAYEILRGNDTPTITSEIYVPIVKEVKYIDKYALDLAKSHSNHNINNLFNWLCSYFPKNEVINVFDKYNVTTNYRGDTCFWYIDNKGNICRDKNMKYLPNGRRNRDDKFATYTKYKTKDGYSAKCIFGGHLITKDVVPAVVESEKTALICSLYYPSEVWVATGGKSKIGIVEPNWFLYPDIDGIEDWTNNGRIVKWWENPEFDDCIIDMESSCDIGDIIINSIDNKKQGV